MNLASIEQLIGWDRKSGREKYLSKYRLCGLIGRLVWPLPLPLWRLLQAYGCDKQCPGWYSYGRSYGKLFRSLKYRRIKLLEIGIGGYEGSLRGGSLLAWGAFFPFGMIIAADIVPKLGLSGGPRRIRRVDQSSSADLDKLVREDGPFDLIVDDGSHFSAHQIFTFERIFGALKDGGIYIVEYVQTSFWSGCVAGVEWDGADINSSAFSRTAHNYFWELARYLNQVEVLNKDGLDHRLEAMAKRVTKITFQHNMIVRHKGANSEQSAFVKW
jgi:hypothetical protein